MHVKGRAPACLYSYKHIFHFMWVNYLFTMNNTSVLSSSQQGPTRTGTCTSTTCDPFNVNNEERAYMITWTQTRRHESEGIIKNAVMLHRSLFLFFLDFSVASVGHVALQLVLANSRMWRLHQHSDGHNWKQMPLWLMGYVLVCGRGAADGKRGDCIWWEPMQMELLKD